MKKGKMLFMLSLILFASLLSACSDTELEFMADILVAWLKAGDILTPTDQINVGGVFNAMAADTIKAVTQDEESESLEWFPQVFDNIVDADDAAQRALDNKDPEAAAEAVKLRPESWDYRETSVAVWLANDNVVAAEAEAEKADELILENVNAGADCVSMRRQQLIYRLEQLKAVQSPGDSLVNGIINETEEEINRLNAGDMQDTLCDPNSLNSVLGLPAN